MRPRLFRIATAAAEIAASTAIAIKIGISGEEPSSSEEVGGAGWLVCCREPASLPEEPLPGLPCSVPPLLPVAAPPVDEDGFPAEDPPPDEPEVPEPGMAPPSAPEEFAGGLL